VWINFSGLIDNKKTRKEKIMEELNVDKRVIEVIDRYNLTPLTALIIHYLTDPKVEYTSKNIVESCQSILQQGSRRHVRRIRQEMRDIVSDIHLAREMDCLTVPNEFTTEGMTIEKENIEGHVWEGKKSNGGNGGIKETDDGFWDVTEELDCVTSCSKAPENGYVFLSSIAWKKIKLYMKWAGNQEWLSYLVGKFVEDNTVEVTDIVLPNQDASQVLVNKVILDDYNQLGIVGVIHSHHEMGGAGGEKAGFSGHDEAFINSNHNVSLLVAKDGIAGHIRVKTPCGAFLRINAKVKQMDEVELDEKKLKEEFKSKIRFGRNGYSGGAYVSPKTKDPFSDRNSYHF
jgi:hypothetical protein